MANNKDKKGSNKIERNNFMLAVIFIIFCLPIILSVTRIGQEGSRQFSIYNNDWDGTSTLKNNLESEGFEFQPIVSTLNTLTRLETVGTVALIGPTRFFDPTETAALAYFILRGGSVLIADDFGRANDILGIVNMVLAPFLDNINLSAVGFSSAPLAGIKINQSVLMDRDSCYYHPVMPILKKFYNFPGGPSMNGISQVVTSYPSSISFLGYDATTGEKQWVAGFNYQGVPIPSGIATTTVESWLETDMASIRNGDARVNDGEWSGVEFSVMFPIPLGVIGVGNILICSDPSIFINELMDLSSFDNGLLASRLFNWLDVNNTRIVYYDESHLSLASGGRALLSIFDPFSYVRIYLRYVDSFTMFPLLAPMFPLIMFLMLKRRFPKRKGPSPLLMTKVKQQRSRSFFAAKMTWYMNYQQFEIAIKLLYKRLIRQIQKKFMITEDLNSDSIIGLLEANYPSEFNIKEIDTTLKRIELIIQKNRKLTEEEFTRLVFEIKNIEDIVTRPNV
ncbi:MAG TPA: DUF4350 domain-containing protein [Candidatus Bathyarchaeia archaeon]|nr:DUF4350 domain-containing protein [Candidatus Bathyarchaeia archaeon]